MAGINTTPVTSIPTAATTTPATAIPLAESVTIEVPTTSTDATISCADRSIHEVYCGNSLKQRNFNHLSSFRVLERRYMTLLTSHIWQLRDEEIPYSIAWKILENPGPYINRTKQCKLCIAEHMGILKGPSWTPGRRFLDHKTVAQPKINGQ